MTYEEVKEEWESDKGYITARTSGSTGEPREIRLGKRFVRDSAERSCRLFGINERSRLHSCLRADTIGGKMMLIRALISGAGFTYEIPSNQPMLHYEGAPASLVSMVAPQLHYFATHPELHGKAEKILAGGSPLNAQLLGVVADSGLAVYESYGMTETASHIAVRKVERIPTGFRPLDGISVATDSRGCLTIGFAGGETVTTNDLAVISPDGTFMITGRYDGMIITGGVKVNPTEIEESLGDIIGEPYLVASLTDMKWGQEMIVAVEGEAPPAEEQQRLASMIRARLEGARRPKKIYWTRRLPQKDSGKPDRGPFRSGWGEELKFYMI